jgi:hypothetical protein
LKLQRLDQLKVGDTIKWQEQPTKVVGVKRISEIKVCLQLAPHQPHEEGVKPKDNSFWTRPIAAGLTVGLPSGTGPLTARCG